MNMNELRIYLTGFMTCGKSTIGPIVANVLGMNFIDLDKEIERSERRTIVEIFEQEGEQYFRNVERIFLENMSQRKNIIVALGGGTITNHQNIALIKKNGKIIYLEVSPEILYKRLKNKIDRPLFRDLVLGGNPESDFINRIKEMLDQRKEFYEEADYIINTDFNPIGVTVDTIAKNILRLANEKN